MAWGLPNLCRMKRICPNKLCPNPNACPKIGFYVRSSDSRTIQRFRCNRCKKSFSTATFDPRFGQKKRRANVPLYRLLCSGVSQRRAALLLNIHRATVVRKFRFLADRARANHLQFLKQFETSPAELVQFDDVETSEHSKCKPLSISMAVETTHRKILAFEVSIMPAKPPLVEKALRKYGPRPDHRPQGLRNMFAALKPIVSPVASFTSDRHFFYPGPLRRAFPHAEHIRVWARRGCIAGQGELKRIGYDPLFSLNHTAAMLRANINRLFRKTWCTTKKRERLIDHLYLYTTFHNEILTREKVINSPTQGCVPV